MNVAIDLTPLLPQATGVDVYCKQLITCLGRLDRDNHYTIFMNYEDRLLFDGLLPRNFTIAPSSLRPRAARLLFQQVELPVAAAALAIDVIHSPSFLMPFYRGRQRHLLTVHDMTFFSLPDCHTPLHRSRAFRRGIASGIHRADLVSVPSASTKQDILALLPKTKPERIRVVPYGVGDDFRPRRFEEAQTAVRRLGLPQRYILHVGTIEPRKNLVRLVESYRRLISAGDITEHLVLAGRPGWSFESLFTMLDAPDLRGRVHLTGYVAQSDLALLYAGAKLFVYPSLHEGFGLPPLEAMACGVPTIASLSSSLAENLRGAAELVPPTDETALTAAMRQLLCEEHLRARYRKRGLQRVTEFRWEKTALETLGCYRELAAWQRTR